jgi:formate-dependent nitrite reductase membrane component NrfD
VGGPAARVVYDVAHTAPWGWIPALYLWTKAAGGGLLMIAGGLAGLGWSSREPVIFRIISPAAALFLLALTAVLLIADLKRPDRFYYILIKPNPRSWLVWGTWILMLASAVAAGWLACGVMGIPLPSAVFWLAAALGVASACYSGFLFA